MADNILTLATAANLLPISKIREQGLVEMFASKSPITKNLGLKLSDSPTEYGFQKEKKIALAQWRTLNDNVDGSHSEFTNVQERIFPLNCVVPIDRVFTKGKDNDLIRTQTEGAIKGMSVALTKTFFDGDNSIVDNEPDGLNVRLAASGQEQELGTNDGLYVLGSAANAVTFLDTLLLATEKVDEPAGEGRKVWFMSLEMRILIDRAINTSGLFQAIEKRKIGEIEYLFYNGYEVILIGKDTDEVDILGFNESSTSGLNSDCGSIYLANLSTQDGVHLISPDLIGSETIDPTLDVQTNRAQHLYDFELLLGIVLRKDKAAYRVKGIRKVT